MKFVNPACSIFATCRTGQPHVSHSYLFKKKNSYEVFESCRQYLRSLSYRTAPCQSLVSFQKTTPAMKCLYPACSIFATCRTGQPHVSHSYLFKKQHQQTAVICLKQLHCQACHPQIFTTSCHSYSSTAAS